MLISFSFKQKFIKQLLNSNEEVNAYHDCKNEAALDEFFLEELLDEDLYILNAYQKYNIILRKRDD